MYVIMVIISSLSLSRNWVFNTLWPRRNGHRFADNVSKCIFLNENICILIIISLQFVPEGQINNVPALAQIMAWCWPGNKPFSEPMMESLLRHIPVCVTLPQWVNRYLYFSHQLTLCVLMVSYEPTNLVQHWCSNSRPVPQQCETQVLRRTDNFFKIFLSFHVYNHCSTSNFLAYCKHSDIRCTKSQNLNVSRLGLQLSLRNILKSSLKWRMKM